MSVPPDSIDTLSPVQLEELTKGSAISLDVLRRAGVYGEADPKAAAKLLGRAPKYWAGHLPVTIYPYHLPFHRDPVRVRGKPATPFETPRDDGSVTLAKYVEAKGSPVHLYFGPSLLDGGRALKDITIPLWITEGEKKALAAESAGLSCVALSGVTQWHEKGQRTLHPDFAHLAIRDRIIPLAFDRDALSNKQVRDQETAFGRALLAAGAIPVVVRFPQDAPKLDDFLARHELSELMELLEDAKKHGRITAEVFAKGVPAPATETTDLGNAERFAAMHGDTLRYCKQTSTWYSWQGKRWVADDDDLVIRCAYRTVRKIYEEADSLADEEARAAMRQHARASEANARVQAMVKMAGALKRFAVRLDHFDSDPWLLNCENGTVDLRTGVLREHRTSDMITKLAPVYFDPDAVHERWDTFLGHISNGDASVADFLSRAVGYSLTGDTREDRLFFLYGPPGYGKSTFVGAVESALGDYARTADIATFLQPLHGSGGDKPRPDLVRLAGARIVVCKEIDQGAKLAEGLVKTITGGDAIAVRDLHAKPLEFKPSFKLWLVANDPPVVRGDDAGMWRRILRIPFVREFASVDRGFREALQHEPELRAAVLAWAVRGVRTWLEEGLIIPDVIVQSTADYRSEMDPTGEFFDRQCVFEADAKVPRKALRKAYEEWCTELGHTPLGARRFAGALRDRVRAAKLLPEGVELETNLRQEHKWVDGWRCVRLLTDFERAGERAERAWGRKPTVHRGDFRGDRGQSEANPDNFSNVQPSNNSAPYTENNSGPQYPQSPQIDKKREEDQKVRVGEKSGEIGDNESPPGAKGRKWTL